MNHQYEKESLDNLNALDLLRIISNSENRSKKEADFPYLSFSIFKKIKDKIEKEEEDIIAHQSTINLLSTVYTYLMNASILGVLLFYCFTKHYELLTGLLAILLFSYSVAGLIVGLTQEISYPWILKKLNKNKKLSFKREKLSIYREKITQMLKNKQFQHAYLTHVQLNISKYEKALIELQGKNQIQSVDKWNKLKTDFQWLKNIQADVMKKFINDDNGMATLRCLTQVEEKINEIDEGLKVEKSFDEKQDEFVKLHQQFLASQGLTHLSRFMELSSDDKEEKIQDMHHEESLKVLL